MNIKYIFIVQKRERERQTHHLTAYAYYPIIESQPDKQSLTKLIYSILRPLHGVTKMSRLWLD